MESEAAESLQRVLHNLAAHFGLSPEEMCTVSMMAVSNMAKDIDPGISGEVAKMGAPIDINFVISEVAKVLDPEGPMVKRRNGH